MTEASHSSNPQRFSALGQLVLARLREFWREPAAIFWVYVFPLIMIVALGVAFRNRPAETITVDVTSGAKAEAVVSVLDADPRFRIQVFDEETAGRRLRTGRSDVIVGWSSGNDAEYLYSFDPTKPGSLLARNAVDDALQRFAGRTDPIVTDDHLMLEPGGRYIDFLVPGLLGMGLLGGGLWGVGFALVDMRIRKLLKRFVATPMKRSQFLTSVMISRLLFTIPEVVLILLFSRYAFGVVNYGSYLALILLIVLGAFAFSGIGLLLGCRARKLETISGLTNLVMLPMWIGSGIFFSTERFPDAVQPVIQFLPLTPLIDAMRRVMLEGATLSSLGLEMGAVGAWGVVAFALALRFFRWS